MSATHSPPAAARLNEVQGPPPRTTSDERPSPPRTVPDEVQGLPSTHGLEEPDNPLARLTSEQIEELGKEFDALHDEVFAELGDRLIGAAFAGQQVAAVGSGEEILRAAFDDAQAVLA